MIEATPRERSRANHRRVSADQQLDPVSALMRILSERWVLTLALRDGDEAPYPTPLFYALAEPDSIGRHRAPLLLFASSASTHHGRLTGRGPTPAAAAVYLESETIKALRGAQLRGLLLRDDALTAAAAQAARAIYLARHPVAEPALASGSHHLYALLVTWAKLTDNRVRRPAASDSPGAHKLAAHPEARFDAGWSALAVVEQSQA